MKQEEFEAKAKSASKEMLKKKAPTRPETQFVKGALWAWDLLEPERWQELLISETATMMADRDGMQTDILTEGRLLEKYDKNMNPYKESNPLYVHLKELQRSIGMQREHLGLTNKSSKKMESPKTHDVKDDPLGEYFEGIRD